MHVHSKHIGIHENEYELPGLPTRARNRDPDSKALKTVPSIQGTQQFLGTEYSILQIASGVRQHCKHPLEPSNSCAAQHAWRVAVHGSAAASCSPVSPASSDQSRRKTRCHTTWFRAYNGCPAHDRVWAVGAVKEFTKDCGTEEVRAGMLRMLW